MKSKKKIAIIGTVGLPACYGGFETLTAHLVENLHEQYDFTVYCSAKRYKRQERATHYKQARLVYLPFDANGVQSIFYDTISILHALFYADVLLILGVAGTWILPFIRLFTRKKIITSIDGIEWKRDKWNKWAKFYLWWAEGVAVRYSHIDISDNESIQDYTAQRYGSLSRIVEYGADHTLCCSPTQADYLTYPFLQAGYAFKVCRIEPENNLHTVLEAFAGLPTCTLVIVGNWEKSDYGKNLKEKYSSFSNIWLLNPIYNQRTLDLLRGNASLYVHGHSVGGTNPSLVDAMFLGLPIIAFGVCYNRTTTENKALFFEDTESLQTQIQNTSETDLQKIGKQMKNIANRRYTWRVIAQKYTFLIQEALTTKHKKQLKPVYQNLHKKKLEKYKMLHLQHQKMFFE
jgi:glycosyltransferase involved in cell wall biosynthesis